MVATDGYTGGLVPFLDERVRATRGQVLVTGPLGRMLYPRPHYSRHGFDYWQQLPDGRLVIGGRRDASLDTEWTAVEETTPVIQDRIEQLAAQLVGGRPDVTHRWAGNLGHVPGRSPARRPCAGRRTACGPPLGIPGHGNVIGFPGR